MKIALYGLGNFGFALLKYLDIHSVNNDIYAYDRNLELINHLNITRTHLFFHKDQIISKQIYFVTSIEELIENSDIVILAVNSYAVKEVVSQIKPYLKNKVIILNTAKALDSLSGKRLSEIVKYELKDKNFYYAVIAGGTISNDLLKANPLGVDLASSDLITLNILKKTFQSDCLKVYTTFDIIGVEYASSFKNVLSILAGIIHGLGYSYGSETFIISRASLEIKKLIISLGGKEKTFSMESQCWGNDLWMSSTGPTRNREFGILIGQGLNSNESIKQMQQKNKTVEGINTIKNIKQIIFSNQDYPFLQAIYEIVINNIDPKIKFKEILTKNEI